MAGGLVALAVLLPACRREVPLPTVARVGDAMGTTFSVAAWGRDSNRLARAVHAAFDSVRLVDSLLTLDRDASEVSIVNRRGYGRPVSRAFAAVLDAALRVARRSNGAFDPTQRNWRGVAFDSARGTVGLRRGLTLDFREIAKGYALDRALLALRATADSAVLDFGGQYLIMTPETPAPGAGAGAGRQVGVADPDNSLRAIAVIQLRPGIWSVSTASPAAQVAPILDPRTGQPAARARSVTAVARDGLAADAWATAFFVLGCDSALALAPQLEGMGVLCVDDRVRWSADLDGQVALTTDSAVSAGTGPGRAPGRALPGARAASGSTPQRATPDSWRSRSRTS
ncbi:MAG: FAD:protein FMN transferase [Gemmatimonadales bacterium]